MPTRTFETKKIIEWGLREWEDCEHVVHFALVGRAGLELTFRAPDDGKLWRIYFAPKTDMRPEPLSFEAIEVEERTKTITVYEPVADIGPMTVDTLVDLLGLAMVPDEIPSSEILEALTQDELEEVGQWAADIHVEASDNPIEVGPMPACLRDRLPAGHTYKTWRVEGSRT